MPARPELSVICINWNEKRKSPAYFYRRLFEEKNWRDENQPIMKEAEQYGRLLSQWVAWRTSLLNMITPNIA
jgi:hypothetical protein